MKRNTVVILFAAICAIQLAVPFSMILRHEHVLKQGTVHRFLTEPVDPYDAFRGRYVALRLAPDSVATNHNWTFKTGDTVFVTVASDDNGFARLAGISHTPPKTPDYFKTTVCCTRANQVDVEIPFDRYYMTESAAPAAEILYRAAASVTNDNTYVTVRLLGGSGVIEQLYINNTPVERALAEDSAGKPYPDSER